MKTTLYAGLAVLVLGGCSEGLDEPWPPTVEQIKADLGVPPRGEMRLRTYGASTIRGQGKAYWYYRSCQLFVYFSDINDNQDKFFYGGLLMRSVSNECYGEYDLIYKGYYELVTNEHSGSALVREVSIGSDSLLRGVIAGETFGHFLPYAKVAYTFSAVRVDPP